MKRILFVHNHPATFVKQDLALLRKRYEVREWYQKGRFVNLGSSPYRVGKRDMKVKTFLLHLATTPALEVSNLYCQIDTRVATR